MMNQPVPTPELTPHRLSRRRMPVALLAAVVISLLVSCSRRPGRVEPPSYNGNAGAAAVSQYDTNGDGAIAEDEFSGAPALKASLQQVDADGDGRLTAQEIDARIQAWRDKRTAEMPVGCEITLDGAPLSGAKIELEPESYLGTTVKPAFATTDEEGVATLSMVEENLADPRYPGVACGWYKIRVTSDNVSLPAHYNTQTTLGCEVAPDAHWTTEGAVRIELKSGPAS